MIISRQFAANSRVLSFVPALSRLRKSDLSGFFRENIDVTFSALSFNASLWSTATLHRAPALLPSCKCDVKSDSTVNFPTYACILRRARTNHDRRM